MPKRIQLSRKKGYKLPSNTVVVSRPSRWGNPFSINEYGREKAIEYYRECVLNNAMAYYYFDEIQATIMYEKFKWISDNISILKDKDLACWCKPNEKCHADILLKIANYTNDD